MGWEGIAARAGAAGTTNSTSLQGKTLVALWPLSTEQAGREPGMDTFPWKTRVWPNPVL